MRGRVKRHADPIAYAPGFFGAWGIGCYARGCAKRLADPIAYAPGLYGAGGDRGLHVGSLYPRGWSWHSITYVTTASIPRVS